MEKAIISSIKYEASDSIEMQGKRKDINKYINNGYYVKENRNGYWVLVKSAKLNVSLRNSACIRTYNMKADVCDHYGKKRISQSLTDRFIKDTEGGKVFIYMDSEGNYSLK